MTCGQANGVKASSNHRPSSLGHRSGPFYVEMLKKLRQNEQLWENNVEGLLCKSRG